MIPLLPLLALAGGALAYGEWQRKRGAKSSQDKASKDAASTSNNSEKTAAQNIYNYNGLSDSALGNTLFQEPNSSPAKVYQKRNLFK